MCLLVRRLSMSHSVHRLHLHSVSHSVHRLLSSVWLVLVLDECQQEEEGEEKEEEGLFKADAVNEEDSERDRATQYQ